MNENRLLKEIERKIDELLQLEEEFQRERTEYLVGDVSALNVIVNSPYEFYLSGSRRMAERLSLREGYISSDSNNVVIDITPETDYDYYITFSESVKKYLIDNGFEPSEASDYYYDDEVVEILCKGKVQVVLRRDAVFYKHVFDNIDPIIYYTFLWKSSPTCPDREFIKIFFNMFYRIA